MFRVAIIIAVLAFLLLCNIVAVRMLLKLHPRRKWIVIALALAGNVVWTILPFLRSSSALMRAIRATFGPPWFAWLSFVFVYTCFLAIAALVARRHLKTASRFFLWTALVALALGVYGALVPLRVERVTVRLRDLPPQLDGFRIAEMADLHVGLFTRRSRLQRIFTTAAEIKPDVAVIAGDMIDDDPYFVPKLLEGTRSLPDSIPLLAVLGNHETYGDPDSVIAQMRGSRIRLLVNEGAPIRDLWVAGISDYAGRGPLKPDFAKALSGKPAHAFPLVLAHQPKAFPDAQRLRLPLTICAHSHGGQLGFRPLRWSLAGVFLPYHMGLYQRGDSQLYVNTGTGYWLLPWRLGITPEITLIELRRR